MPAVDSLLHPILWWLPLLGPVVFGLCAWVFRGSARLRYGALWPLAQGALLYWGHPVVSANGNWLGTIWYGLGWAFLVLWYVVFAFHCLGLLLLQKIKAR